jgi:FkbH-like protein
MGRSQYYATDQRRNVTQAQFASYGEFLDSLEMRAEIGRFAPVYMDRIAQLTGKTNQFNLTTRRYTASELEAIRTDPHHIALYGRLADKFGDNGLVSVVVGRVVDAEVVIDLWLMSCRVLKRGLELAMFDALVEAALAGGHRVLRGTYLRTAKNALVADHYEKLGFDLVAQSEQGSEWRLLLPEQPARRNVHIKEISHG